MSEISGHPHVEALTREGRKMRITVCSECEALSTVLYLDGDRWYCTKCRAEGVARPTVVPLTRPTKRR